MEHRSRVRGSSIASSSGRSSSSLPVVPKEYSVAVIGVGIDVGRFSQLLSSDPEVSALAPVIVDLTSTVTPAKCLIHFGMLDKSSPDLLSSETPHTLILAFSESDFPFRISEQLRLACNLINTAIFSRLPVYATFVANEIEQDSEHLRNQSIFGQTSHLLSELIPDAIIKRWTVSADLPPLSSDITIFEHVITLDIQGMDALNILIAAACNRMEKGKQPEPKSKSKFECVCF